jgi:hypothetical protein
MNTDDFSYIVKENERLRRIIESYDSAGGLGEVFALVAGWIEHWERRVEEAEYRADAAELELDRLKEPTVPWETTEQMLQRVKTACKGIE